MKNKLYEYKGFELYEVLDKNVQDGQYLSDNFWKYYEVSCPDRYGSFRFDYYKEAEHFIHEASLAYIPHDVYTERGRKELESDIKLVRSMLNDMYASHRSIEPSTFNYLMTARLHRVLFTLLRHNTLNLNVSKYFPMEPHTRPGSKHHHGDHHD